MIAKTSEIIVYLPFAKVFLFCCCRDHLAHQVPQVSLVLLVPLQEEQQRVLGRSDHQERTGHPVNL